MLLFDIDTQNDFLLPAGALYVPGAERLLPQLERIYAAARERGWAVIASTDAHLENDPEFAAWPAHCVRGTMGQQKVHGTLWPDRVVIPNRPQATVNAGAAQVVVEKQTLDVFSNPNLEALLAAHPGQECGVFGVATDYCVRFAVEGLLRAGRRVVLFSDAIRGIDAAASEQVLRGAAERGARLTTSAALSA